MRIRNSLIASCGSALLAGGLGTSECLLGGGGALVGGGVGEQAIG